jgi:hypothetical protein
VKVIMNRLIRVVVFCAMLGGSSALADPPAGTTSPPCADATASPWARHHGLTLEAGFGAAAVQSSGAYGRLDGPLYSAGLSVGAWLSPRVSLSARIASASYKILSGDDEDAIAHVVLGPSLQYWVTSWAWASAGAGVSVRARSVDYSAFGYAFGWGFDTRLGVTLDQGTRHTFTLAIEISPTFHSPSIVDGLAARYLVVGLVAGYQYL